MKVAIVDSSTACAACLLCAAAVALCCWLVYTLLWSPWRTLLFYRKQGLQSPSYRPIFGNSSEMREARLSAPRKAIPIEDHGYAEALIPHVFAWRQQCAPGTQRLVYQDMWRTEVLLWEANQAREFLTKAKYYKRDYTTKKLLQKMTGMGLVALDTGDFWEQQRKLLNSAFRVQYIKGLHKHMLKASQELVESWAHHVKSSNGSAEIFISSDIKLAAFNVISRCTFGAHVTGSALPVEIGTKAFQALDQLQVANQQNRMTLKFHLPALLGQLLPETETEKIVKKKGKFIDDLLGEIVEARIQAVRSAYAQDGQKQAVRGEREQCNKGGHDVLGIMVDAMLRGSKTMTKPQILRECRTMFAAGYHTSALTITWTLPLLAHNTEWQEKAREEVRRVTANTGEVDADNADKLHILRMIISETLRLYTPGSLIGRKAAVRHKLGDLDILPGTNVVLQVSLLHLDPTYWDEPKAFKPNRFQHGVAAATRHHEGFAYVPFGGGPRICIGMNLSLLEMKTLLASILHRFSLQVSPNYQHIPSFAISRDTNAELLLVQELQP